jgi:hypothetical protein
MLVLLIWAKPTFFIYKQTLQNNRMKIIRIIFLTTIFLLLTFAASSCFTTKKVENKKHKPVGWFKNSNNPHHPATTNPGHTKWKSNKKKKHK